jgi:hypothetical protein
MNTTVFFSWLAAVTLCAAGILAALHTFAPETQPHWKFSLASVILFALVCTGLYVAGTRAIRSKSKAAFINLVSGSVFGKMVLAIAFLFVYQRIARPPNEWYVGIFLFCYVLYTAFEVWFMTRLSRA